MEPNREMREAAEGLLASTPHYGSSWGRAEDTGLDDAWADVVTAAQAFHWFDAVVRRGASSPVSCAREAGWHSSGTSAAATRPPFLREYEALLRARVPDYTKSSHRNWDVQVLADFFAPGRMESYTCGNEQWMDFSALRGRLLSSSYTPKQGQAGHDELMADLAVLFGKHQRDGQVCLEYQTEVYLGRLEVTT